MDWLYEKNKNNTSRYVLGTVGHKPLVCIGINPSTAEPGKLDNTLASVERISLANGYDSWIMLNVYPQRSTDPNNLHELRDFTIDRDNMNAIRMILEEYKPTIWAAWGRIIHKRPYLMNSLYEIIGASKANGCRWVNAGPLLKDGHPHHPLYLKSTEQLRDFDADAYVKKVGIRCVFSYVKILKNQSRFDTSDFNQALLNAGLLDNPYYNKFITQPMNMDMELNRLENGDIDLTKALLTGIMREENATGYSFDKRIQNGDVMRVLLKLREQLNN